MSARNPALAPFEVLIGTWDTGAVHRSVGTAVSGWTTYEWLEGEQFIVQRSHTDHEQFPDGISIIGPPESGDGLVQEYFDSRGVRRTYRIALDDGVLRIWRDAPGFDQRFEATLAPDVFEGIFELSQTPGEWIEDMRVTYRRRA